MSQGSVFGGTHSIWATWNALLYSNLMDEPGGIFVVPCSCQLEGAGGVLASPESFC